MSIYGPGLGTLWRLLDSYGLDPSRVIDPADFSPGAAPRPAARVPFSKYDALRTRAAELIGDPAVGLRSASHLHPSHLGALGYAWLASSCLLTGFRRLLRHGRMVNDREFFVLEERPERVILTFHTAAPVGRPAEVADAFLAGLTALCRMNAGRGFRPERATFRREAPGDAEPWLRFFQSPVDFGSDLDRLVVSRADATRLLSGADPRLVALHEDVVRRDLASLDRDDILNRARVEITDKLATGEVTEESVASALHMTRRTLHRRLSDQGETFRSLLADVRKTLALKYLEDPGLPLTEIGFLLGYSDSNSFSRSFRRWSGRTPSEARAGSPVRASTTRPEAR